MEGAPELILPLFTLPGALPGTAQWVSPFVSGYPSYHEVTMIQLIGLAAGVATIHLVPPGGTATNVNKFFNAVVVAVNTNVEKTYFDKQLILPAGYSIWAFAGGAATTNLMITGIRYP